METTSTRSGYGNFGNLNENYSKARRGFPSEALEYIFSILDIQCPHILDLGCGTGIATRQIYEVGAEITGSDIDAQMVKRAQEDSIKGIKYLVATAERQPFGNCTFDAITAFSAFHWFANAETLDEIRRLLKPTGWLFVINKNETGNFKQENRRILQMFIKQELPDVKKDYDPQTILIKHGFHSVAEKVFPVSEYLTIEEAVFYIQTMSIWNLIPEHNKKKALDVMQKHFLETANSSKQVERRLNVVVVSGQP